jgi:hypothetical protein
VSTVNRHPCNETLIIGQTFGWKCHKEQLFIMVRASAIRRLSEMFLFFTPLQSTEQAISAGWRPLIVFGFVQILFISINAICLSSKLSYKRQQYKKFT